MLYGLFRCEECGHEELKRVPFYAADVPHNFSTIDLRVDENPQTVGGRISFKCTNLMLMAGFDFLEGAFVEEYVCGGEMILDTRYNFHGCLPGELTLMQGALHYVGKSREFWIVPQPTWEDWDHLPVPLMV